MEEDSFDWYGPDVVARSYGAIAVHLNGGDDIVIRQQEDVAEEDRFVVIPRAQVRDVLDAVSALLAKKRP